MSASTAAPISSVSTEPGDNQFQLSDHESDTHVTLNLQQAGPLAPGSTGGPILQYQGSEGTLSFSGEQLVTESTALGEMFTVTLNVVPDLRTLKFTLLLPSVIHKAGARTQAFHTIAIKAQHHTSLTGTPATAGANPSYVVLKMHGTAAKLEIPA